MTGKEALANVGRGFLQLADFRQVVDANNQLKHIELSNYGEVFLNPDLLGILRYAHKTRVALSIYNGANLNTASDMLLEGIVRHRLRSLTCSIDGAAQASYAHYRVGGNFDRVIRNVKRIIHFKEKYKTELPFLRWQFIVFGHNQQEIPIARAMARQLGMQFSVKLSWDDTFSPITDKTALRQILGVASREEYSRINGQNYMRSMCYQLWDSPQINWDGKVLGCGRNFWGDFGGNAFRDGLLASLNNDKIVYAREVLQGRQPMCSELPCSTCELYYDLQKTGNWLKPKPPALTAYLKSLLRYYLPATLGRYEIPHKRQRRYGEQT